MIEHLLRTLVIPAIAAAALVACSSPPRVQVTTGPTAELNDRLQVDADEGKPRVFAVLAIDGVEIPPLGRMSLGPGARQRTH